MPFVRTFYAAMQLTHVIGADGHGDGASPG